MLHTGNVWQRLTIKDSLKGPGTAGSFFGTGIDASCNSLKHGNKGSLRKSARLEQFVESGHDDLTFVL